MARRAPRDAAPRRANRPSREGAAPTTHRLERRQHILAAARNVFARRGYHEATIDDIVAEAGVARGTFYLYFGDKRAVFSDLIDRFSARISMAILRIDPEDAGRPVAEQVQDNIRAILGVCLSERSLTKILLADAAGADAGFERRLGTFYDEVVLLLTECLREGQSLGIVRDGEPRVLAYLTLGALKELLYQAVTLGLAEESAEALAHHVFAFLAGGYLRVEPERRPVRGRRSG